MTWCCRLTVYLGDVVTSLAAREQAVKVSWEVWDVQTVVNHLEVEK